eukprot:COSAG03_NODE_2264_length_2937_cov_24.849542_5_plen_90_part_00
MVRREAFGPAKEKHALSYSLLSLSASNRGGWWEAGRESTPMMNADPAARDAATFEQDLHTGRETVRARERGEGGREGGLEAGRTGGRET